MTMPKKKWRNLDIQEQYDFLEVEGKVEALEKSHEECLKDRDKIHNRVSKYKGRP